MSQKGVIPLYIIIGILIAVLAGAFIYSKQNSVKKLSTGSQDNQKQATASGTVTTTPSPTARASVPVLPTQSTIIKPTTKPTLAPTPTLTSVPTSTPVPKVACTINTDVTSGWLPLNVHFSYSASDQGRVTGSEWDLDGNGTWESEASQTNWVYKDVKSYEARLRLKLSDGSYSDTCTKTITINPSLVTCQINADVTSGPAPLAVQFTYGAAIKGVSGNEYVTVVQWDFNGDGTWDTPYDYSSQTPPVYTYSSPGNYTAKMHLKTNSSLESDICTKSITVN